MKKHSIIDEQPNVFKAGFLQKQPRKANARFVGWHRRYFMLVKTQLKLYRNREDIAPKAWPIRILLRIRKSLKSTTRL
jgi:hypothetical protein